MAVIGHAFLGWATGLAVGPRPAGHARGGDWPVAVRQHRLASFWIPVLVVLAYLPDIAGQVLSAAGVSAARLLAHSLLFAGLAGVLVGVALARWSHLSPVRLGLIAFASIVGHDLVDLLGATDRLPLWPISSRPLGFGSQLLPASSLREAAAFGLAFAAFEVV